MASRWHLDGPDAAVTAVDIKGAAPALTGRRHGTSPDDEDRSDVQGTDSKPPRRSRGEGAITDLGKGRIRAAIWLAVRVNP